jgi:hemoglobin
MQPSPPVESDNPWGDAATPYLAIGGESSLQKLVDDFYDIVESSSPVLAGMLPADTSVSRTKLFEFLSGWTGGPNLYWERRGHPRLRMRHFPFSIGDFEAEEWMRCMTEALDANAIEEPLRSFLITKLKESALHVRNRA